MRALVICLIGAVNVSANTILTSIQRCSSSTVPAIAVTQGGKAVSRAHLDVYRQIEHGERLYWTGLADAEGVARPRMLLPGEYRVFANAGKQATTMLLQVSNDRTTTRCEMQLAPGVDPNSPQALNELASRTPIVKVKDFRGVVQDEKGAAIPHLKTQIMPKNSANHESVAGIVSDEKGQFAVHLRDRAYTAIFDYPGFRRRVVNVVLGNGGWNGFRLNMIVAGGSDGYVPAEDWQQSRQ